MTIKKKQIEYSSEDIFFYDDTGEKTKEEHRFLNNFAKSEFIADDNFKYPTCEHYYQAHKFSWFNDKDYFDKCFEEVRKEETPLKAKKTARAHQKHEKFDISKWDKLKEVVMKKGLTYKFSQNKDLLERLVKTGDKTLREESKRDKYWGGLLEGSKNTLGAMLMELRDNYKKDGKMYIEGSGLDKIDPK